MKILLVIGILFSFVGCSSFHVCHKDTPYYDQQKCEDMLKAKEEQEKFRYWPDRH